MHISGGEILHPFTPSALCRRVVIPCGALAILIAVHAIGATPAAAAAPVEVFLRSPATLQQSATDGRATVSVDAGAVQQFRLAGGGILSVPLPEGGALSLTLREQPVLTPDAVVTSTDELGSHPVTPDVSVWRGQVVGSPGSWAVLSFSRLGVLGVIEQGGERIVIGPEEPVAPGSDGLEAIHLVANAADLPARLGAFICGVDGLAEDRRLPRAGSEQVRPRTLDAPRLVCELAVDCDYEFYANKFGFNLLNATNYAITVVGVVSAIYDNDIDVAIRVSYLNVWTTAADPYTKTNTGEQLPEFSTYWNLNRTTVPRHLAHLFSGRSLGGGIAQLEVLCDRPNAYAVSQLDAFYTYPTPTATWDATVVAHEIGHNFVSPHTQSCYWQSIGACPPNGMLDSCFTSEGGCYVGATGILPPDKGTIMSYCHLVAGVANGIRLEFHAACKTLMRTHAELCLPLGAFDAGLLLTAAQSGNDVLLNWNASPQPGVIRYDVYRSQGSLSLTPELAGSSVTTSFTDFGRIGTYFYRVRAVRASDESQYSNEIVIASCLPSAAACFTAGSSVTSPIAADFNRDGIMDVAVANSVVSGSVSVLLGQGTAGVGDGTFGAAILSPCGTKPVGLAVADFDEDGILDLAVVNDAFSGTVNLLRGTGSGSFAAPVSYAVGPTPSAIATADFNEDGIADLAVTNYGNGTLSLLLGQGSGGVATGTFAPAVSHPVRTQPTSIGVGDFNEDGITDLAVVNNGSRNVSILIGQGTGPVGNGTFATQVTYNIGLNARALAISDFNADGISDIVVTRASSVNVIAVLIGQGGGGVGNGTFAAAVEYPGGTVPTVPAVTDFNGDGIADLVVTSGAANGFSLLVGRQSGLMALGSFEGPQTFGVSGVPSGIVAGDFDEDGVPDVAVTSGGNELCVVRGACPGSAPDGITVLTPNGGEAWPAGTEKVITWSRGSGVMAVDIEVTRDNGTRWETIARGVTNSSYAWSVADPISGPGNARIRLTDPAVPGRTDQSDAGFEITPNPLLAVGPRGESELSLAALYPDPAPDGLSVSLSLPTSARATLELVDVAGRRVQRREVGHLGEGRHIVQLGARMRLQSGLYLVRLIQGDREVVTKAALIR